MKLRHKKMARSFSRVTMKRFRAWWRGEYEPMLTFAALELNARWTRQFRSVL